MIDGFQGKTAFITGGASGLGFSMARHFAADGAKLMLADIGQEALDEAVALLRAQNAHVEGVLCDVSDRASVFAAAEAARDAFGKVHIVCNNAGVAPGGPADAMSAEDWQWVVDVNLMGVVHGIQAFVPMLKEQNEGGHVVNTASMAGLMGIASLGAYCATKSAVVAISEALAGELAPFNIGVSVLCPGFVRTRIHESDRARPERYGAAGDESAVGEELREATRQLVLSGIEPEVVAARVAEAIQGNELYIFTHPAMRGAVEARFAAILAAYDSAERSPALASLPEGGDESSKILATLMADAARRGA
jgi:NAD(P)-dependent dehydrogenase (short-subunit alcohol dehydrogenase family)